MEAEERLHIVGVGAHPDDVAVGAGGVIASYVKRGHRATILNVTYGETVRPPGPQQEEAKQIRRKEGEDIAGKLGAEARFLGWPANTIIPSWEMKALLVNTLRELQANIILFTVPWDTHADHRNLSAAMKDVMYYVGHAGMAFDTPPCRLRSAWMYSWSQTRTSCTTRTSCSTSVTSTTSSWRRSPTPGRSFTGPTTTWRPSRSSTASGASAAARSSRSRSTRTWGSMRLAQLTLEHARVRELPLLPGLEGDQQGLAPEPERGAQARSGAPLVSKHTWAKHREDASVPRAGAARRHPMVTC